MTGDVRTGGCLCGAVRVSARLSSNEIQACHCGQCRRWTGGGPLFVVAVEDPVFEGADRIGAFHLSEWGERAFCKDCGATLYWRMRGRPVSYIAAGMLDDDEGLTVAEEIFADRRAHWMKPWAHAAQSTEAEEFAKLDQALDGSGAAD